MPRETKNELVAGVFTVAALGILIAVIFWLGASDLFRGRGNTAWFYVDQDAGKMSLQPDGQVLVNDVVVGHISSIDLDLRTDRTLYEVKFHRKDINVFKDGKAQVDSALVGGANLVVLDMGNEDAGQSDRENPIIIQASGFGMVMEKLEGVTTEVGILAKRLTGESDKADPASILGKVHALLDTLAVAFQDAATMMSSAKDEMDPENRKALVAKLHETMNSIQQIAQEAQPVISSTLSNVDEMVTDAKPRVKNTLANFEDISTRFKEFTEKDISEILIKLRDISNNILKTSEDLAQVVGEAKDMFLINRDNLDEMLDNLTKVSGDLRAASSEIRRNPWKLLYRPKKGELHSQNIYDAAREFSSGAAQLDQSIAKLTGLLKAYPEGVPSDDPKLKEIKAQLKNTFDKFNKAEQALWEELK